MQIQSPSRSRQRWKKALLLGLSTALVVGLTACSSDDDAEAGNRPDAEGRGGELELLSGTQRDIASFDPAILIADGSSTGSDVIAVYDVLFDYEPKTGELVPRLAVSATANDDFTEWTLVLRSEVRFTDGTPFNSQAVKAHWERVQDPSIGSPATDTAQQIINIDVIDDVTLALSLKKPNADWPVLLNATLGMIPSPTAIEKFGDQYGTSASTTVGAGPFILDSWKRDVRKKYKRNPDYWDSPKPYLDSYIITQVPDPQTRLNMFRSGKGDLNYMPIGGPVLLDLLDEFPYSVSDGGGLSTWAFNFRDGHPTRDRRLRRAMVAAVNVEAVVERGSPGVTPASTLFPEGHIFYAPIQQPHNDLSAAQSFMKEYLEAAGLKTETVRLVTNAQFTELAEALKQDFDRVDGLNVKIEVLESALTAGLAGDFDLLLRGLGGQVASDWAEHLTTGGLANRAGVSLPKLDDVFSIIVSTDDMVVRRDAIKEMQRIFMDEAVHLLVYRMGQYVFCRDTVANVDQLSRTAVDPATLQAAN